ncbi:hypothetical protein GL218_02993 [Daldinia childiae]|uniref:uncharacterized protein n=1 Tax=Daldinia childiae TaxID=326645 RepID=UPI0014486D8D|nr:uncharacterized protein GL218_02993 [Daldinia childiae]KAF3061048.1 hypothetical protein GL218_02993 [Daldinia childiae]
MGDSISPEVLQAILNGPSAIPPEGVVQNLDNPPNGNGRAIALVVVCLFLVMTAALMRAYSRIFIVKKLHIEDFLGLCALGCYIGTIWCYFYFLTTIGFFVHQWDLRAYTLPDQAYIVFILDLVYQLSLIFAKTAILLEWARVFAPDHTRDTFFWACRFLMVLNILFYVGSIISVFLTCTPLERTWKFWVSGTCIAQRPRDIIIAAFNLALDTFILILPQGIIWTLQMNRKRKLGVSLVFSVGLLACVCAAGRVETTVVDVFYPRTLQETFDASYVIGKVFMWVIPEQTCVLLVFCVPAVPKAFSENSLASRALASWRSWSRVSLAPRGQQNTKGSGSGNSNWALRTIGSAPSSLRAYRKVDEEAQTKDLNELAVMRARYTEAHSEHLGERPTDASIFKTTEVNQKEDVGSKVSGDFCIERQHPWMKE